MFVAIIVFIARCGYKLEKADEEKERAQALSFFAQSFILMEWLAPHLLCLSFNGLRQESLQLRTSVECAFAYEDKMLHTYKVLSEKELGQLHSNMWLFFLVVQCLAAAQ